MADQALTKFTPLGSFLLHFESSVVCMESGVVSAPATSGATDLDMVGYPVTGDPVNGYVLALEADSAAGITGYIAEQGLLTLAANGAADRPMRILARGPAAVVGDQIPAADIAGTNFTKANIVAAMEAEGIVVRNEPVKTSTQTT